MEESIYDTLFKFIGFDSTDNEAEAEFGNEILTYGNVAFNNLAQIGAVEEGFEITKGTSWITCLGSRDANMLSSIAMYVKLYTKLAVDPPLEATRKAQQDRLNETFWRLQIHYDRPGDDKNVED